MLHDRSLTALLEYITLIEILTVLLEYLELVSCLQGLIV